MLFSMDQRNHPWLQRAVTEPEFGRLFKLLDALSRPAGVSDKFADPGAQDRGNLVLVVDLDGALIPSNARHEVFWSTVSANWRAIFGFALSKVARHDHAARPGASQEMADVRVDLFPYDPNVIRFIKQRQEQGLKAVLVTTSDQTLADALSQHLGLFDQAFGTVLPDEDAGGTAMDALAETTFVYLTGSHPDPVLMASAEKTIFAGDLSENGTVRQDGVIGAEGTKSRTVSAKTYLRLIRPHQWIKNTLVFLTALLAVELSPAHLAQCVAAFVIFSLVASSVYVINDLLDLSTDRAHPRKRTRPFASGAIPLEHGVWMGPGLFLLGFSLAIPLGQTFLLTVAGYVALTTVYSVYLKHKFLLDIATLATLYTLRIVAGAAATGLPMSGWLLAFSIFFFLSLAAVKRQAELVGGPATGRSAGSGHGYVAKDLGLVEVIAGISGGLSVLVLAFYLNTPVATEIYTSPLVTWGGSAVLLVWLGRIVFAAHRGKVEDDPVLYAVKDWFSWSCLATMVLLALLGSWT